jgi:hypothetical protein
MNFQRVEAANGQLETMKGLLVEVGGVTLNSKQKQQCKCKVQDEAGVKHNVTFHAGNKGCPNPNDLNQWGIMSLSTFQGNYQGKPYTGYSGFWNGVAAGQPQTTPQTATAAAPPQQPKKEPDWDAKDMRIVAQCCAKPFMEAQANGKMPFDEAAINARSWLVWIYSQDFGVIKNEACRGQQANRYVNGMEDPVCPPEDVMMEHSGNGDDIPF